MKRFKETDAKLLQENMFKAIGSDWMLVTSGNSQNFNTMTASWGGIGILWNKNVSFVFIRPQRYTFEFMEKNEYYSLSFFDKKYKSALTFCGTNSGKNVDKIEKTGLTPNFSESSPYFDEAKMIIICKKIYTDFIKPEAFIDKTLEKNYKDKDYHKMYVGEIVKVLVKDEK